MSAPADRGLTFAWFPTDLTLPPGSYAASERGDGAGGHIGVFVVPSGPAAFTNAATSQLNGAGWAGGPIDIEANEAEASFTKSGKFIAFGINTYTYCGTGQLTLHAN